MDDEDSAEERTGGGLDPELIKSYLQFVRRALRAHRWMSALIFVAGIGLTVAAFRYLPRTYTCTTVLMVDSSQVLEGNYGPNVLVAAESLIARHENLEGIVRDIGLIKKWQARRPPLLAFKDRLLASLFGPPSDEAMRSVLVGTLETRLNVRVGNGTLTISVDWTDGKTAAEVVEAARESFVKARHTAEMSAFEEKLAILDGHATSLRDEIEGLAKQARTLLEQRDESYRAATRAVVSAATKDTGDLAPRARPRATTGTAVDTLGPELKEELEKKRQRLAEWDRDHDQRVAEERRKLEDLKLRLTPNHPDVVTAQRRLASVEQVPSEIALLRSEVQSLNGELKQRDILSRGGSGGGGRTLVPGMTPPPIEPLPRDIGQLLDAGNIDPALAAQLGSAVSKYGALRDDIRNGRIQFDTAQAAFNFRYKVVVPADPPSNPIKPKAAMVLGGGLLLSLLLTFLLPIVAELRSGIVVERWQVATLQLPVLADLRLPPMAGSERDSGPPSRTRG
jgi:uncharacterized protein involved in exopolysaccharide biosynthesis